MTIQVEIKHTMPGYDKAITVEKKYLDVNGTWQSYPSEHYKTVVQPGESTLQTIWSTEGVFVSEGPAATAQPPANAE